MSPISKRSLGVLTKIFPFVILLIFISSPVSAVNKKVKKAATPVETEPSGEEVDLTKTFYKGDQVEAFWKGAWYKAKIENVVKKEVDKPVYKVSFDGYWHNWDREVAHDEVRRVPTRVPIDPQSLAKGDAVEYLDGGDHWIPGVFVEKKDKKNMILQVKDGKKTKEESVPYYKIRKLQ